MFRFKASLDRTKSRRIPRIIYENKPTVDAAAAADDDDDDDAGTEQRTTHNDAISKLSAAAGSRFVQRLETIDRQPTQSNRNCHRPTDGQTDGQTDSRRGEARYM